VVKASTGTLFRTPLLYCKQLDAALHESKKNGATVLGLSSHASKTIAQQEDKPFIIYILGNETDGVSDAVAQQCDELISIPMANNVESLNVAVTASLLAFKDALT
jgi:23S rRNA (guanosine2251-2'-O)-methyltransferase